MSDDLIQQRQDRLFHAACRGAKSISSSADAKAFIQAICRQEDRLSCLTTVLTADNGLLAARQALVVDLSTSALGTHSADFILYFTTSTLADAAGGQLLKDLLQCILSPSILWNAYQSAADSLTLNALGLHAYASLVSMLLRLLPQSSELAHQLDIDHAARSLLDSGQLQRCGVVQVRHLGSRIREHLDRRLDSNTAILDGTSRPGGRHDNDFADFRRIAIFPTRDQLESDEQPHILPADEVFTTESSSRVAVHVDNQFRLLHEDMLFGLRDDLKSASQGKTLKHGGLRLRGLQFSGLNCGDARKPQLASLIFRCYDGTLKGLPSDVKERRQYLVKNPAFIKHGSFGCILAAGEVIGFATVKREVDLLAQEPSVILLCLADGSFATAVLTALKLRNPHEIEFLGINTPIFAYEPVLRRLQAMSSSPLLESVVLTNVDGDSQESLYQLEELTGQIWNLQGSDISELLEIESRKVCLDRAQTESLVAGLTKKICQIQGPPGTGKSFIGALEAKVLLEHVPAAKIMLMCYTNHALDQFLEDLLDIGVPAELMLRLGAKSTERTSSLSLQNQPYADARESRSQYSFRKYCEERTVVAAESLTARATFFSKWKLTDDDLLQGLEFDERYERFFHALTVPPEDDGMIRVGPDGKAFNADYLLKRWIAGKDAGVFKDAVATQHEDIWNLTKSERSKHFASWKEYACAERARTLAMRLDQYTEQFARWSSARGSNIAGVMRSKRIIACTTTAAAKYADQIALVKPSILLIEEAGEVLESHILTALSPATKQIIMIGDHQQLRPKVKNWRLMVEKGDGFNLNCSLFERLIKAGHPHTVLTKQHRMRPEISTLVRRLTYPSLEDGEEVLSREGIHGLQSNVVFIDHRHPEVSDARLRDISDGTMKASRQNAFEARMVVKIVKYLAQQGYGTDKQVVLTPYLGQLSLIVDELKADHDPVLSDLDSFELIKAGLITPAGAAQKKRQLRVSTVDNYQGEESDIVIASLTRSNDQGIIGFMGAAQRLNVLLSRARDGLIIVGNAATFRASKQGKTVWNPFFEQLLKNGHLFDGLPVKCQRHPAQLVTLRAPADFDKHCANGGCNLRCQTKLACGQHRCPELCHQLVDHSHMRCMEFVSSICSKNHQVRRRCHEIALPCPICKRDQAMQQARRAKQEAYLQDLLALEDQINQQCEDIKDLDEDVARAEDLRRKTDELERTTRSAKRKKETQADARAAVKADNFGQDAYIVSDVAIDESSKAARSWKKQKESFQAENVHIDAIMDMIGLESVKVQVLSVKNKVDISLRQGTSVDQVRFNAIFVGNPGTGKTTVARHYAACLAMLGVVAGDKVVETTASRLLAGGMPAYQRIVDEVLNEGGGAVFIDEAYQLAAPGGHILDRIMDDAENMTGKIVFLLAGYRKEMEQLLSHNPGLTSRFPYEFGFADYEDDELHRILIQKMQGRFRGRLRIEDGPNGLYARVVARRIGYSRGRPGFGNARAVENVLDVIHNRQTNRIAAAAETGEEIDLHLLTKEDMLGPEPGAALQNSKAWKALQELTGLQQVKASVLALIDSIRSNYERELKEEPLLRFNLNRVLLGSPGTGKTTVAKLYGQVLAELGLLSNGEVISKTPSDFVGDVLGASERNTKGILAAALGKVLVIDEAYGLHTSTSSGSSACDPYKTAVIDTLVAEVQSVPGDDRCVLLLGYQDEMEKMLQHANPGLARRFPISDAFHFEDFTDHELADILEMKLAHQGYSATDAAKSCIAEELKRARNKLHFGNAGEVDIILNKAKLKHQQRCTRTGISSSVLEVEDFDPMTAQSQVSIENLFRDTIGNASLVARMQQIENMVTNLRKRNIDPRGQVPYNFVFHGPPGTGKTTTARKIGMIYHGLGILATTEVLERSASDLVAGYVGQTGEKTRKLLESALGKVLLIDEAYRLITGDFAKEAIDELVDLLTKPTFAGKVIVILAGYDQDIERLMRSNPGLTSRFPERVSFQSMSSTACAALLLTRLNGESYLDTAEIQSLSMSASVLGLFDELAKTEGWANARDVQNIAKTITRSKLQAPAMSEEDVLRVEEEEVVLVLQEMLEERRKRAIPRPDINLNSPNASKQATSRLEAHHALSRPPQKTSAIESSTAAAEQIHQREEEQRPSQKEALKTIATRDPGVDDEVWTQLTIDKRRADEAEEHFVSLSEELEKLSEKQDARKSPEQSSDDEDEDVTARASRLRREQERLHMERLRREKEKLAAERDLETKRQEQLQVMGVCCMGFRWIKQANGYRCAGGSHYVDNVALAASE